MKMNDFETREELYQNILRRIWRGRKNKSFCTVPTISGYGGYSNKYQHAITVAALWAMAGVERMKVTERFEDYSISQMLMSSTSLVTSPYIGVHCPPFSSRPAIWWIADILQLGHGGVADSERNRVQVSWLPRKDRNPVDTMDVHTVFDAVRTKILRDYPGTSSAQDMYDYYYSLEAKK